MVDIRTFFKPQRSAAGSDSPAAAVAPLGAAKAEATGPPTSARRSRQSADASSGSTKPAKRDSVQAEGDARQESEISEYERKRLERMAQNAAFLQQVGLSSGAALSARAEPATKKRRRVAEPPAPSRRSTRLQGGVAEGESGVSGGTEGSSVASEGGREEPDESFDDSSVLKYICGERKFTVGSRTIAPARDGDDPAATARTALVGFSLDDSAPVMADPSLKKIYALSFTPFEENGLVAAGGHQGYVSIYPLAPPAELREAAEEAGRDTVAPLMSFKAHSGWVSSVSLSKSVRNEKHLLLTASNDSFVKVWDLNQSSAVLKSAKEVLKTSSVHRSGIFGMDALGDSLLTCSKDATIALSRFRDGNCSALEVLHRFDNHDGVVKSVAFSRVNADLFASGGNDRALRVFDVRQRGSTALEIRNAHSRAINSVQWHPTNANWIVSASFDPDLRLFDTRKPSLPLFTFFGHYLDTQQNAIYHPVFVDGGDAIAAAGGSRCQEISLYKSTDGSTPIDASWCRKNDHLNKVRDLLSNYEALVAENAKLRRENDALRAGGSGGSRSGGR